MKAKMMFPSWIAFYYFRNFFDRATIRKSKIIRKTTKREYRILFFHMVTFLEPMFPNRISEGSGADVMTIFDLEPSSN